MAGSSSGRSAFSVVFVVMLFASRFQLWCANVLKKLANAVMRR